MKDTETEVDYTEIVPAAETVEKVWRRLEEGKLIVTNDAIYRTNHRGKSGRTSRIPRESVTGTAIVDRYNVESDSMGPIWISFGLGLSLIVVALLGSLLPGALGKLVEGVFGLIGLASIVEGVIKLGRADSTKTRSAEVTFYYGSGRQLNVDLDRNNASEVLEVVAR